MVLQIVVKTSTFPLWWDTLLREQKSQQSLAKNLGLPKIIYIRVDWRFTCSIYFELSGVFSNGHFSTYAILDSLLSSVSLSLNPFLSFSLFLSSAYSPFCFYLSLFNIKGGGLRMIGIIE